MKDKTILITGGSGTIGNALIKYILKFDPKKIIVFSRDEFKHHRMKLKYHDKRIEYFIGDVRDIDALKNAFKNVDIVIHAAALKQVPVGEIFPEETIKTNVIGSSNVASIAGRMRVDKCLLISSDKSVEPINAYGATKLLAEKIFMASNRKWNTKYSVVRYGNVIGSRGSFIETLVKNRLKEIPITDPDMTRYWITLKEACNLIIFALENMEGGEVFIPKVKSMRLIDVYRSLSPNSIMKVIGLRPGEKKHEVLVSLNEAPNTYKYKNHYVIYSHVVDVKTRGKKVRRRFFYSSESNKEWYELNEFKDVVSENIK